MSGWGHFYEIEVSARSSLEGLRSKSDWYDALGPYLNSGDLPTLNAEQALTHGWILALRDQRSIFEKLFIGDLRTEADGTGDPEVVFLGSDLVKSLAQSLLQTIEDFFLDLLHAIGGSSEIWLLKPMRSFFETAAARSNAVIIMWGD